MRRSWLRRGAFTLIEVLVVVAIIGVLVGLLLPAVQSTRESARSTSCKNNLIQLHLACESYFAAFDRYPAGTVTERLPARLFPDGKDHGWLVQVRPFLDGGFEFSEAWSPVHSAYHPRNWPLAALGSQAMACPSSPTAYRSNVVPLSYAGVHDGRDQPIDADSQGFFVANRFLRRREISDGLSHTLQLGEILVDPGGAFLWISGNQSTLRTTGIELAATTTEMRRRHFENQPTETPYGHFLDPPQLGYQQIEDAMVDDPFAGDQGPTSDSILYMIEALSADLANDSFGLGESSFGRLVSEYHPEIGSPLFPIPVIKADSTQAAGFASHHASMINAAFADGRVVTISQSIDPRLYGQIGVRNDHAPLSMPLAQFFDP